MSAGAYRHKIEVERKVVTGQNSSGAEQVEWQLAFTTLAKYKALSVRDFIAASAAKSQISGKFTIRYRDIEPGVYRLLWRGVIYKIHGFLPDEKSGRESLTIPVSQDI